MKRLEHSSVPVVAQSHTGRKRKENEDRFGVSAFRLDTDTSTPVLLAVLSDGIGGHRAGEVAAEMAVDLVSRIVAQSDAHDPARILTYAIQAASDSIRDQAAAVSDQAGMGATCACAWMIGDRLYTATVGDSRVYLLRGGGITRLSKDHTWVQEAIDNGLLLPEEVSGHPNAHIIRRYLGSPVAPDVDLRMRVSGVETDEQAEQNQGLRLEPYDRVLLTSDGLTDLVSDTEILEMYRRYPADEATRLLIERANQAGGHDNITLVTFQAPPPPTRSVVSRGKQAAAAAWRWMGIGCVGTLVVALLVAGLAGGAWWLTERWQAATPIPTALLTEVTVTATLTPTKGQAVTTTPVAPALIPSATRTPL
nr:protein phosphatase 2C domain-containing protein [Anaerolinea sp.]